MLFYLAKVGISLELNDSCSPTDSHLFDLSPTTTRTAEKIHNLFTIYHIFFIIHQSVVKSVKSLHHDIHHNNHKNEIQLMWIDGETEKWLQQLQRFIKIPVNISSSTINLNEPNTQKWHHFYRCLFSDFSLATNAPTNRSAYEQWLTLSFIFLELSSRTFFNSKRIWMRGYHLFGTSEMAFNIWCCWVGTEYPGRHHRLCIRLRRRCRRLHRLESKSQHKSNLIQSNALTALWMILNRICDEWEWNGLRIWVSKVNWMSWENKTGPTIRPTEQPNNSFRLCCCSLGNIFLWLSFFFVFSTSSIFIQLFARMASNSSPAVNYKEANDS